MSIPSEAADLVFECFVDAPSDLTTFVEICEMSERAFLDKERLYRISVVMLCILVCEREDSRFADLRKRYEEIVYGIAYKSSGEEFLRSSANAIEDFQILLASSSTNVSWAREWFAEIGVDITNVVRMGIFVMIWLDLFYYTTKALREIRDTSP